MKLRRQAHTGQRSMRRWRRRGYGTLIFMMALAVMIGLMLLAVNYAYLAYAQLRLADVTDTLARTAVSELLDEQRLEPGVVVAAQGDDVLAARELVEAFVAKNNALAPASQQLNYVADSQSPFFAQNDLEVTAGYVDNVEQPLVGSNFLESANGPFNTLRVTASRPDSGNNRLYLLVRGFAFPEAASIGSAAYATLDSRLIGFQPTATTNVPLAPIAIEENAWLQRAGDEDNNQRTDFTGHMESDGSGNVALVSFVENATVDPSLIPAQLAAGLGVADIEIAGQTFVGPVVPGQATLELPTEDRTPTPQQATAIATALNDIAASDEPRRLFPLFRKNGADDYSVVGFVSARVIQGDYDANRLKVVIEPAFLVHFTAVTAPMFTNGNMPAETVPENIYIHKLRLAR